MVFKLVRIDNTNSFKLHLPVGKHIIGRTNFLHEEDLDKRVSRNHAELEVTENVVLLKSIHQNPCFYIKFDSEEKQLLQQNCEVSLSNGDKFGLLPDHCWYQLVNVLSDADETVSTTDNVDNGVHKENGMNEIENEIISERDCQEPPIMTEVSNITNENAEQDTILNTEQESTENTAEVQVPPNESNPPIKRSYSAHNSPDVKKVKTEPDESGDVKPGPSNDQMVTSNTNTSDRGDGSPGTPQKPTNNVMRERCMYGANCYRRNPQHKAQFSHPTDSDWGPGAQAPCPWGAGCQRLDPRHWRDHTHPNGTSPPGPNAVRQPGKKRTKKNVSDSEEEPDSPSRDLIVTGKRVRKTVDRQTWSGSEEEWEIDPYGTDESDEWHPSSDLTQSQD